MQHKKSRRLSNLDKFDTHIKVLNYFKTDGGIPFHALHFFFFGIPRGEKLENRKWWDFCMFPFFCFYRQWKMAFLFISFFFFFNTSQQQICKIIDMKYVLPVHSIVSIIWRSRRQVDVSLYMRGLVADVSGCEKFKWNFKLAVFNSNVIQFFFSLCISLLLFSF